jgi:hypothetical protein
MKNPKKKAELLLGKDSLCLVVVFVFVSTISFHVLCDKLYMCDLLTNYTI